MTKQAKNLSAEEIREQVVSHMATLSAEDKIIYSATKKIELKMANDKAQKLVEREAKEAHKAGIHSCILIYGMCIPMLGFVACSSEIPMEVGYVFGAGLVGAMAYAVWFGAKHSLTKFTADKKMVSLRVTAETAKEICDNDTAVQEVNADRRDKLGKLGETVAEMKR